MACSQIVYNDSWSLGQTHLWNLGLSSCHRALLKIVLDEHIACGPGGLLYCKSETLILTFVLWRSVQLALSRCSKYVFTTPVNELTLLIEPDMPAL